LPRCDIILAADSAQFGYPEVNIGFVAAMVMAILRRSVSEKPRLNWWLRVRLSPLRAHKNWASFIASIPMTGSPLR